MTPKERKRAIAEKRPYDRLPHGFRLGYTASKTAGISVSDFHLDAKKQVEATVAAYRTYGLDETGVRINIEEVIGATFEYPDYREPFISGTVALEGEFLENLSLGDPKKHPKLKTFWQVLDGLFDAVGEEVPIAVSFRGPFSGSAAAIGTEKFLRLILKKPDYIHRLLEKVVTAEISIVDSLSGYDIGFDISDPIASGTVISQRQYQQFAKPYQKRLFDAMARISGRKPQYHICGDTSRILRDMVETGAGEISVDNLMDLDYVAGQLGTDAVMVGNVNPSTSMLLGTPDIVRQDLRNCLKKGSKAKGGYLPAFGCGLPIGTPAENLNALFEAFGKYAKYPFDPEKL
jgi:uroporphyrinogen decarboxylase